MPKAKVLRFLLLAVPTLTCAWIGTTSGTKLSQGSGLDVHSALPEFMDDGGEASDAVHSERLNGVDGIALLQIAKDLVVLCYRLILFQRMSPKANRGFVPRNSSLWSVGTALGYSRCTVSMSRAMARNCSFECEPSPSTRITTLVDPYLAK